MIYVRSINKGNKMVTLYRVIQETETGDEFACFSGTQWECENWIDENFENYPESHFYIEQKF